MLSTSNVAVQFGAKPLFEQVTVKFVDGNRYGLIGANGSGKSTLMKVLGRDLDASAGDVVLQTGMRLGKLNQNQFGYEDQRVLDVVMQGHAELWKAMTERDRIYANPNATDADFMRAAELEAVFAEYGGYDAEARAGSILTDAGIDESRHNGPMREVPPGLKLRVLLAQALFSQPDVLLLDEPTNNLDIHSIRWLEGALNNYDATMVIISHDRHFLNQVCTHIADLDYQQLKIYPGNYDDFMLASVQARARVEASNAKARGQDLGPAGVRAALLRQRLQGAAGDLAQEAAGEDQARGDPALLAPESLHPLRAGEEAVSLGGDGRQDLVPLSRARTTTCSQRHLQHRGGRARRHHRPERRRQDHADALPRRRAHAHRRPHRVGRECADRATCRRIRRRNSSRPCDLFTWMSQYTGKADDDQLVRATLGRLLFSGEETKKSVKRALRRREGPDDLRQADADRPNVLLMDEPTNHMDMETIESLQIGLEHFAGTLRVRLARPRVRGRPRHPHHRAEARCGASPISGAPTTST